MWPIQLIVLLVKAIQELSQQNEGLNTKISSLNSGKTLENNTDNKSVGEIVSADPNPFNTSTSITYTVNPGYKNATLSVISETGFEVAKIGVKQSGNNNFMFVGDLLKPGSYYAYLNVNGVIVDYRKIVLAK